MAKGFPAFPASVAVLDIGSNTVLLLSMAADGRILREASRITRLGQDVFQTGHLTEAAAIRTREAVRELAALARLDGATRVVAVGTEALRRASDGAAFLADLVERDFLDSARLLTGEEEAEVAIEASRRAADPNSTLVVIDVGGGSTEVALSRPGARPRGVSLPLGSVRLTEAFYFAHPVPAHARALLAAELERETRPIAELIGGRLSAEAEVVAVAGTATTLAALELRLATWDAERVEGYEVNRELLSRWIARLAEMAVEARKRLPGLEPGRADVIVAGLEVLLAVVDRLGVERFRVSGRGVRHGVAQRLLSGEISV